MLQRSALKYLPNTAQQGDALALLQSLSDSCTPLVFFDPQHRGVLEYLKFGNEGARQRGRADLPSMTEEYINAGCGEHQKLPRNGREEVEHQFILKLQGGA
jgi:site-specific DNA-methyltransferase (adenine-specific)